MKPPSKYGSGSRTPGGPRPHGGDGPNRSRTGAAGAKPHGGQARRPPPDRSKGPRPNGERFHGERQQPERRPAVEAAHDRPDALRLPTPADKPHRERPEPPRRTEPRPPTPPRAGGTEAPRGTVWLYGTHAVAAALANPARRLRRLMLTEEAEAQVALAIRQAWPIAPERADRARLDQLLGHTVVHQGAALLVDPLPSPTLQQALERSGPVLVLDQVSDPRNVGAILRCAAAFRVAAVITQDRNAPEETGALAKAASGALETVPMLRAVNIARTLVALRAAGLWIVGLDARGAPLSGPALAQRRVALVLGSEGEGMRRLTRETCDELAGIAMPGAGELMESLNVSAAAAVALYEIGRRS
jgi:23S rRNA (guanosine2251-2'-O)-methyltransferase